MSKSKVLLTAALFVLIAAAIGAFSLFNALGWRIQ